MNEFVNSIANAMESSLGAPLTVLLLAMIPIAEARFAILFGVSMGMSPIEAFGWAFLGSSIMAPVLLLTFIPIIKALSKTRAFSKLGKFLYDKFEKKSKSVNAGGNSDGQNADVSHKKKLSKKDLEKMGGTALFVAVPIPLTGVWTGSAVASIVKIGFFKALVSVIAGNAVACGIMALLSWAFAPYIDYITVAFAVLALCVVVFLIVKLILYKPKDEKAEAAATSENASVSADAPSNSATEECITPSVTDCMTVDHDEINDNDRSG